MATRPRLVFGFDHPIAFAVLEQALETAKSFLSPFSPQEWGGLPEAQLRALRPRWNGLEGGIDFAGEAFESGVGEVVARAFLPFRYWPLGGWAVYDGWRRSADGVWTPLGHEEAMQLW